MANDLVRETNKRLKALSASQLSLVNEILKTFERPIQATRNAASDVVSDEFLIAFGDVLKLHHTLSMDYLDKHRFEAALERVFATIGKDASRHQNPNNPGHDLTIDGERWSVKTQGDRNIKRSIVHISKFMELGKGRWENEADLRGLRDQFLRHLKSYDRVFQLRYFMLTSELEPVRHDYELVEIPKSLLQRAKNGVFKMMNESRQNPKPGYCTVSDRMSQVLFQLYFDAGTERKLQIKNLRKELCIVHGTWCF